MQVIQIGRNRIVFRDVIEILILGRGDHIRLAEQARLFDRLVGPYARIHVTGFFLKQVIRHLEKLGTGAAAQKQYFIVVGHLQQFAEKRFRFVVDRFEISGSVRNFKQGQTDTVKIKDGLGRILDRYAGQDGRPGAEIVFFHNASQ